VDESVKAKVERFFGSRLHGVVRAKYVCDRFHAELKYKHVYPFPIYEKKDEGGRVMYYMIHASDHDEARVLMNRAYGKALDIKETGKQLEFFGQSLKDALGS
jgi:hypothetical protein